MYITGNFEIELSQFISAMTGHVHCRLDLLDSFNRDHTVCRDQFITTPYLFHHHITTRYGAQKGNSIIQWPLQRKFQYIGALYLPVQPLSPAAPCYHIIYAFPAVELISRDRLVVRTLRCGRNNPGSNPGHGNFFVWAGLTSLS